MATKKKATTKKATTKTSKKKSTKSECSGVVIATDKAAKSLTIYIKDEGQYKLTISAKRYGKGKPVCFSRQGCVWDGSGWVCNNISNKKGDNG
jgi:hypothetical protein